MTEAEIPGKEPCKGQLGPVGHALSFESQDESLIEVLWTDCVQRRTGPSCMLLPTWVMLSELL